MTVLYLATLDDLKDAYEENCSLGFLLILRLWVGGHRGLMCLVGLLSLTNVENTNFLQRFIYWRKFSPAIPRGLYE